MVAFNNENFLNSGFSVRKMNDLTLTYFPDFTYTNGSSSVGKLRI